MHIDKYLRLHKFVLEFLRLQIYSIPTSNIKARKDRGETADNRAYNCLKLYYHGKNQIARTRKGDELLWNTSQPSENGRG